MILDKAGWSGDGDFTIELVAALESIEEIASLKVEDAPASQSGAGYNFLVNEIFLTFATERQTRTRKLMGLIPLPQQIDVPRMTLSGLEARLASVEGIGAPDYSDEGMLQYLRTERVIPPYQTRGYKMVEMVRIYLAGTPPRA